MKNKQIIDIIKATKGAVRKDEIHSHGHSVNYHTVVRNKKKYTRKTKHKSKDY